MWFGVEILSSKRPLEAFKTRHNTEALQEPANPSFVLPRAPTVSLEEAKYVPSKYNFSEVFDIPELLVKKFSLKQTGEAITRCCQLVVGLH